MLIGRQLLAAGTVAVLLCAGPHPAGAQGLVMSDDFESAGATVNSTLWPYSSATKVTNTESFFGPTNRYLWMNGAGIKALSADWSSRLNDTNSTFAFDYYEPLASGDGLIAGYTAGTSDINTAGAFARVNIGSGSVSLDATDGTSLTNTGTLTYPRDTRLTFSLVLNDSAIPRDFNGGTIAARTMEVWYYNWSSKQSVFVMAIDVAASARNPVCLGLRTWSTSTDVLAYIDNVKLLDAPVVVTEPFLPSDPPVVPPRPFVHPSVLNTQEELDRMKYRVNNEPGSAMVAGWNRLIASSLASLSYQHVPYSNVVVMGSGTTSSETQCRNDSPGGARRGPALGGHGRHPVSGQSHDDPKRLGGGVCHPEPGGGDLRKQLWLEAAVVRACLGGRRRHHPLLQPRGGGLERHKHSPL